MGRDYVAVIQAGGKGTRMVELTGDKIPKPMLMLNGKPMIQWQIENIYKYGITEFIIIVGHLGEKIEEYFGDGSKMGVHIQYIREYEPLGSAGALYFLKNMISSDFLLIFGDVMFDIDWMRMIDFHEKKNGMATLLAHPNAHPYDSDLLLVDDGQKVIGIDSKKNVRKWWYENCVNAGIYILSFGILDFLKGAIKTDLEQDVLVKLIADNQVYAYRTPEYVKDAGTVARFRTVSEEQKNGIWEMKNLHNKQKCVFLDRDGTINKYCGLLNREEQFELEEGVAEAIRMLNEAGFLTIVVTNQPVVARGMCDISDVVNIHKKMQVLLGENGAYLDDIVFCPHHPDKGYPEENPAYKILCNCRKPAIGMVSVMVDKYNIDINNSYIVGDSTIDIKMGVNAGLQTILLNTGQRGMDKKYDIKPKYKAEDLKTAVKIILKN